MTDNELEDMGIIRDDSLMTNRYWCNATQTNILLPPTATPKDVLKLIYDLGIEHGIERGMEKRSDQFMNLLNNKV